MQAKMDLRCSEWGLVWARSREGSRRPHWCFLKLGGAEMLGLGNGQCEVLLLTRFTISLSSPKIRNQFQTGTDLGPERAIPVLLGWGKLGLLAFEPNILAQTNQQPLAKPSHPDGDSRQRHPSKKGHSSWSLTSSSN